MPSINNNTSANNTSSSTRSKTTKTMRSIQVGNTDKSKPITPIALDTTETLNALKTTRDFEHSRQRAMKTVQVKNWKEEKARNRYIKLELRKIQPALPPQPIRRVGRGGAPAAVFRESERPDRDLDVSTDSDWECDEEVAPTWQPTEKIEVDLTHLIRPAKPRKSKTGDFEVIPKVRSVVVLDDRLDAEPEVDDPWEYVSAFEDDTVKGHPISYAQAVTNVR